MKDLSPPTTSIGRLLIRADATPTMGVGHVMRCIALAQAWNDAGGCSTFMAANLPESLSQRISEEGFDEAMTPQIPGTEQDALALAAKAEEIDAAAIVIDGYQFDARFHDSIVSTKRMVMTIDDYGHLTHYSTDIVLNQNLDADATIYNNRAANTEVLLGPSYSLLRREFLNGSRTRTVDHGGAQRVLITLGGADGSNVTEVVIKAITSITSSDWKARIIAGSANPHLSRLADLIGSDSRLELFINVTDMSVHYRWADLAITAGGSSNWEMCYYGLPRIILVTADNQLPIAEALHRHGAGTNLGFVQLDSIENIRDCIESKLNRPDLYMQEAITSMALVDGHGASRCVRKITGTGQIAIPELASSRPFVLSTRLATMEDANRLFVWRNDPDVRMASRSSEEITFESHVHWLEKSLSNSERRLLVAEIDGVPVGTVRLDFGRIAELSWTVAPNVRGKGIGSQMVESVVANIDKPLIAVTKSTNLASRKVAERAGFQLVVQSREWLTYLKMPCIESI